MNKPTSPKRVAKQGGPKAMNPPLDPALLNNDSSDSYVGTYAEAGLLEVQAGVARGWIKFSSKHASEAEVQLHCAGKKIGAGLATTNDAKNRPVDLPENALMFSIKLSEASASVSGSPITISTSDEALLVRQEIFLFPVVHQDLIRITGLADNVLRFEIQKTSNPNDELKLALFVDGLAAGAFTITLPNVGRTNLTLNVPKKYWDGALHDFLIQPINENFQTSSFAGTTQAISTPWVHLKDNWLDANMSDTVVPSDVVSYTKSLLKNYSEASFTDDILSSRHRAFEVLIGQRSIRSLRQNPIVFPITSQPKVSIVIPVFNQFDMTVRCLCSLMAVYSELSFEVIIGDDCSSDDTKHIEKYFKNIKLSKTKSNQGFVGNCNQAAEQAAGEFIIFLNNDTEVKPGFIDELISPFLNLENVGMTGAKLLNADGSLQEAGGLIWKTGQPWNVGRGENPYFPSWCYTREVDYVSGAALAITDALWNSLGGFNEAFAPGYYEDTDLAFRVREAGKRVIYAAKSVVTHYDGASSHGQVGGGMKRHQEVNGRKFRAKWSRAFRSNGAEGADLHLQKDRGVSVRALVIDAESPMPDRSAGGYAALMEIRALQDLGIKVTFVPDNIAYFGKYTEQLQRMGVECLYAPFYSTIDGILASRGGEFDLIYITRYAIAEKHLAAIKSHAPRAKVVLCNADMHFLRELRHAMFETERLPAAVATRDAELNVYRNVDKVLMYSDVERAVALSHILDDRKISTCPWVAEVTDEPGANCEDRIDITFVGGFRHLPNVYAVKWLHKHVRPLIRRSLPSASFQIVGSNVPADIEMLQSEHFNIVGYVDDLAPIFAKTRVLVAPLFIGAGIKGKVIEALANGIPIVTTSVGAEGLPIANGVNAFVADSPQEFAEAITKLVQDDELWGSIRSAAIMSAKANFGRKRAAEQYRRLLAELEIYV